MIQKYLGFITICSISGMIYFRYSEFQRINKKIEHLIDNNELEKYLIKLNQQSAFSIDNTMNSFQWAYNKSNIENYRVNLCKQCSGKVLQVCAGSNRNIRFYQPGTDLTLIDWSSNMISIGSSKVSPVINYKYLKQDVTQMHFDDNQFDCIIDTFGLQYVINPTSALKQMRRVCKKDGKIILMNQGLSSMVELHFYENMKWGFNLMKGGYFSNRNWEKIIKQFDFDVIFYERKKNGKIYIHVLNNIKNNDLKINQL